MFNLIFLDDERSPENVSWVDYSGDVIDKVIVCRNPYEYYEIFNTEKDLHYLIFSFDHDIQSYDSTGVEITGYTLLKHLCDFCIDKDIDIPKCYFHTKNPVGKLNLETYYRNALKFQEGEK